MKRNQYVPEQLRAKAGLYEERNKAYGDNYKRFGPILSLILADQPLLANDPQSMSRLGIFVQLVSKITRYGENFGRGGHDDSLDDIAVYAMMLKELDQSSVRHSPGVNPDIGDALDIAGSPLVPDTANPEIVPGAKRHDIELAT